MKSRLQEKYRGETVPALMKRFGWKRSEEHTSELQSRLHLVCRLLLEKKKRPGEGLGAVDLPADSGPLPRVWDPGGHGRVLGAAVCQLYSLVQLVASVLCLVRSVSARP